MKYQKSSHVTYDVRYHLVWITKYRKRVLTEEIQKDLDKILRKTCEKLNVVIIEVWYEEDHVHMYIRIPLTMWISETVWQIKWKSSYILKKLHYKHFKRTYWWTDSIWALWYFIATVGEINGEVVKNYVANQWKEENEVTEIEL